MDFFFVFIMHSGWEDCVLGASGELTETISSRFFATLSPQTTFFHFWRTLLISVRLTLVLSPRHSDDTHVYRSIIRFYSHSTTNPWLCLCKTIWVACYQTEKAIQSPRLSADSESALASSLSDATCLVMTLILTSPHSLRLISTDLTCEMNGGFKMWQRTVRAAEGQRSESLVPLPLWGFLGLSGWKSWAISRRTGCSAYLMLN